MALATLFLVPWMLLGRFVRTTLSPSTLMYSQLIMVSKYVPVHISSIATFIYKQKMLENQCPSEVERKSESGLPIGQRCIVGYWQVPTAAEDMLRQHTYTNIIDRGGTNRSSRQSGPILYYPLGWNLSSESIQKKQIGMEVYLAAKGIVAPVTFTTHCCISQKYFLSYMFSCIAYLVYQSLTRAKYYRCLLALKSV